jgi:hypothetical protein
MLKASGFLVPVYETPGYVVENIGYPAKIM